MNAKQRNQNRDTSQTLKLSLMVWNSRNRKLVQPVPFVMVPTGHYLPRLVAVSVKSQ